MNFLYSPSQTKATKDICNHLSQAEKAKIYVYSFLLGITFFCLPATLIYGILWSTFEFSVERLLLSCAFIFILVVIAKALMHKKRQLLLNTEYAKSKGYTLADIVK